ncbi:DUF6615 family protein [Roseiflexus sp.]
MTQNNHLLARFDYLCPDFIRLNLQTGRNLYAARESMFPLCEDTVTEMNLLEIASRHQDRVIVKRFNRKEESKGGADWSWWFLDKKGKKGIGFRIQAKIIDWRSDEFRYLHYYPSQQGSQNPGNQQSQSSSTSGSQRGVKSQTQMLIENAQKFNETPLYCLFTDVWDAEEWYRAAQKWEQAAQTLCGCSLITPYRIWAAATRRWAAIRRRSAIAWQRSAIARQRSAGVQTGGGKISQTKAEVEAQRLEAEARRQENKGQWETAAYLWEEAARRWGAAARRWEDAASWWEDAAYLWEAAARRWEDAASWWEDAARQWEEAARRWEEAVQYDEDAWRAFVDAIGLSSCCCNCGTSHSCDFIQRITHGSSNSNLSCLGSFIDAGCWLLRADAVQKEPGKKSLANFAADIFPWHCLVCCREKYPDLIGKQANLPPYVQQALNERLSFFSLDGESPPEVSEPPEGGPSILVIFF